MQATSAAPLPGTQIDPLYPDEDGRPMGDTDFHNVALITLRQGLEDHFAQRKNVYIASNLVLYYAEDEPAKRRDPDGLVAKGVRGKHKRRSFRVWEEGVVPCVLFEVASRRTWRVDVFEKPELYASIGVKEYFAFDPEGRYLKPVLMGWKTVKGKPVPMKPAADESLVSKELGLRLLPENEILRLIDLKTGKPIPTRWERAEQEKQLAEQESQRADELEAEVQRLRAELVRRTRNKRAN